MKWAWLPFSSCYKLVYELKLPAGLWLNHRKFERSVQQIYSRPIFNCDLWANSLRLTHLMEIPESGKKERECMCVWWGVVSQKNDNSDAVVVNASLLYVSVYVCVSVCGDPYAYYFVICVYCVMCICNDGFFLRNQLKNARCSLQKCTFHIYKWWKYSSEPFTFSSAFSKNFQVSTINLWVQPRLVAFVWLFFFLS